MNINEILNNYLNLEFAVFALAVCVFLTFILAVIALRSNTKQVSKPFVSTNSNADIISNLESKITSLQSVIAETQSQVQKTNIIRYNPFKDSGVGGNQSFSLANVNKNGDGFIITHLFSREMSRVSTKHITSWQSDIELSPEEKEVLTSLK